MAKALEEIYSSYKQPIYNYFYRLTFNSHISEELTQDTFLRAFRYFSSFRGESSVKTWLFKIARNTFIAYSSKNMDMKEENIDNYETENHDDAFSRSDEKLLIRKILHKLSEEERTLIILRDLNGLTYSEISKVMDYTEGKVKIGLHRARGKFRDYYKKEWRVE